MTASVLLVEVLVGLMSVSAARAEVDLLLLFVVIGGKATVVSESLLLRRGLLS